MKFEIQRFSTIKNTSNFGKVWGTSSNDDIYNYGNYSMVWAGDGGDYIVNQNNNYSVIYGESGDDRITNNGRATIYGGGGKDVVYHDNDYSYIDGGNGDDKIYIQGYGSNNTIVGGAGENFISANGKAQVYAFYGDGNDVVENVGANSTIKIANENYSTTSSGSDLIIKVGTTSLTLKNAVGQTLNIESFDPKAGTIENSDADNNFQNDANEVTLRAEKGNDTLRSSGAKVFLSGGEGNDYLRNSGANSTLRGDKGSDWINNSGNYVTISGGKENDYIKNSGSNVIFAYESGDGFDVIEGFNATSTLQINNGRYSRATVGSDVFVNVGGEAVILKGGASLSKINIVGTASEQETVHSPEETRSFTEGDDHFENNYYSFYSFETWYVNTVFYMLGGNDYVYNDNRSSFNSISGGTGDDTVDNRGTYVSIDGGTGNDSISSSGERGTIEGGAGDDVIKNGGAKTKIFGGAGKDSIFNSAANVTITGGADNDTLVNSANDDFLDSGAGDDLISLGGKNNTVRGGTGNDTIYNDGKEQTYYYFDGDGNDTIIGFNEGDTISIAEGKYTSAKSGNDVIIKVGAGSITLKNASGKTLNINGVPNIVEPVDTTPVALNVKNTVNNTLIAGTSLDDTIGNLGDRVTIDGGAGADSVYNEGGDYSYIELGAGNDSLYGYSNYGVTVDAGDGSDTITGSYYKSSKIGAGAGSDYLSLSGGTNNTIEGGAGDDSVYNSGATVKIYAGAGNDTVYNDFVFNSYIELGGGNDSLYGYSNYGVTVDADDGSDTITGDYYGSSKINAGAGSDYLSFSGGINNTIEGGADNDRISLSGAIWSNFKNTIKGGTGNDTIYSNSLSSYGNLYQYASGDGSDTIYGFTTADTLHITSGSYSTTRSGNDFIVNVGSGSIVLKNIFDNYHKVHVRNSSGTVAIYNDVKERYGTSGADTIINPSINASVAVYGQDGNDYIYNESASVTIYGGAGNDSIDNSGDSVTIDGGAGADRISLYSSDYSADSGKNTIAGGAGDDTVYLNSATTIGNVYVYSTGDGNDTIYNLTSYDTISVGGGYSTTASGSDVIIKVGSGSMTLKNVKGTNFKIKGDGNSYTETDTVPAGISISNATLTASTAFTGSKIDLADYPTATKVNASALSRGVSIVGTAAANSLKGGKGADTIFGGAGNDTVSLGGGNDVYVYASGNDLIQDYAAGTDKIKLASASITGASISGSNVVLKTSSGNITVKGGKGKQITVIDKNGNETTNVYPLSTIPAGISIKSSILTASTAFTGSKIDLADYPTATKVNASALSRGVSIVGTAAANSLKGGKGADTIFGGAGNDTVSLGGGADVYVYASGNDYIHDYKVGEDKIKLASASITGASISGSNVVLKTSGGNLTVKNGKNKQLTIIDADGKETSQVYPSLLNYDDSRSSVTLASGFTGTLKAADYDSTVKKIDASAPAKVFVNGNAQANTILGSSGADTIYGATGADSISGAAGADKLFGDAGNDTLWGGAGNDTLTGGAGSDTFVYGSSEGKDVIADYASGDKIKISSGTISKTAYSGQNVVFTVGSGTLTVKNGKGKSISIVDASGRTSTKTYTNGVSYGSNGNVAVPWFTEDDTNFVSGGANLDDISAEKFSVTNVETPANFETLEQDKNIIAYSSK